MGKPLVSVIIPAFNPGILILETIESVRAQTYAPLEIIVVDDGSTDHTSQVLAPLIEKGVVRYLKQENQGQAAARKKGFEASRGTYISFIDADDLIAPEKITLQVDYMETHLDCGVCYSDIAHFWNESPEVLLHKKLVYHEGYIFDKLIQSNFIQVMTSLIRRELLIRCGMPDARFRRSDDWYLWLLLAHQGTKFCFMDRVLSFQRRQAGGTLSDQRSYFKQTADTNLFIYEEFEKILSQEEITRYGIHELKSFWNLRSAIGAVILENASEARSMLSRYYPTTLTGHIKKVGFSLLIMLMPVALLSKIILAIREFQKQRSFSVIHDSHVRLPAAFGSTSRVRGAL